ncbi:hypothetical protein [Paractinoplanes durhamensis]|uniref:Uncharacterized protein n=1 Tax=Paractinoplanes durhamensis TaxID=113563 RepID=A0ABQ3Z0Z9_9ACTN|nr:hypothetical protein [Actinoplanes durhamensis]GIE03512.1 hypothetical protein Adu01nite_48620 [Actinoplanes durhamensis]
MKLSDLLDDVRVDAPPARYDADDAVLAGKRLRRRRRGGMTVAAVVAVAVAIGVPQLAGRAADPLPSLPAAPTPSITPSPTGKAGHGPDLTYTLHGFTTGKLRVDDPYRWSLAGETAMIEKKGGQADAQEGEVTLYRPGIDPRGTLDGAKITATSAIHGRPAWRVDAAGAPLLLWEYADDAMALATVRADGPGRWALTPAELRQVAEALEPGAPQPVMLAFGTSYVPPDYRIVEVAGRFSSGQVSSAQLVPTSEAVARLGRPDPNPKIVRDRRGLMLWLSPTVPSDHGAPRAGVICPERVALKGIPVEKQPRHCFVFLPGGKNVLEVFGPDSADEKELRKLLEGARFGQVDKPATWLAAGTGFPASAQVGGR